jgi:hypothetical protein
MGSYLFGLYLLLAVLAVLKFSHLGFLLAIIVFLIVFLSPVHSFLCSVPVLRILLDTAKDVRGLGPFSKRTLRFQVFNPL